MDEGKSVDVIGLQGLPGSCKGSARAMNAQKEPDEKTTAVDAGIQEDAEYSPPPKYLDSSTWK